MSIANGLLETPFDLFAAQKPLPRQYEWVDQVEHSPAVLHLAGQPLHPQAIVAKGPHRPDVSAHAAPGNDIKFDSVFLQHLYHAYMSQAPGSPRRQGQPHPAAADLARQTANVRMEILISPARPFIHGLGQWTPVDKPVHRAAHLLEQL